MRDSWTDDRLDYLNHRVDDGFKHVGVRFDQVDARFDQVDARFVQVDARFVQIEQRSDERFDHIVREFRITQELVSQRFDLIESRLDKMDTRFEKVDARFERADERFHALHRLIIQGGLGLFGALFVAFLTFLATHL